MGKVARSVKETYREFAANTSIHGALYTIDGNAFTRAIWTLIVLASVGVSVYMISLLLGRFQSNPTLTFIETAYGSTSKIPFPAVTVCNNNKMVQSKIVAFADELILDDNHTKEQVINALPQLVVFFGKIYQFVNTSELVWLSQLLLNNGYDELKAFQRISQSCDELLLRCKWEDKEVYCDTIFTETLTIYGRCCSFNNRIWVKESLLYTDHFGHYMGLKVVTNNFNEKIQYSNVNSVGISVIIHPSDEMFMISNIHRTVATGGMQFLQIFSTLLEDDKFIRQFPRDERDCVYSSESKNTFYPKYSVSNCQKSCIIEHMMDNCGCVPFNLNRSGKPVCTTKELVCMLDSDIEKIENDCDCPFPCEGRGYSILSSGTNIVHDEYSVDELLRGLDLKNSSMFSLYFAREKYTHIKRTLVTDDLYLQSSLGGIFALLIGCSFTSLAEVLYAIFIRFFINVFIINRVKPTERIKVNKMDMREKQLSLGLYENKAFYN